MNQVCQGGGLELTSMAPFASTSVQIFPTDSDNRVGQKANKDLVRGPPAFRRQNAIAVII